MAGVHFLDNSPWSKPLSTCRPASNDCPGFLGFYRMSPSILMAKSYYLNCCPNSNPLPMPCVIAGKESFTLNLFKTCRLCHPQKTLRGRGFQARPAVKASSMRNDELGLWWPSAICAFSQYVIRSGGSSVLKQFQTCCSVVLDGGCFHLGRWQYCLPRERAMLSNHLGRWQGE